MVVLVGNVSAFTNETYRFPGPYVYGSDVRSLTPELLAATRWLRETQGPDRKVVADRFSALALASFGGEWPAAPSAGFPAWQLYFSTRRPSAMLLRELQTAGYAYLVVDRRMARYLPRIGVYFEPDEPEAYRRTAPPPAAALDRYERMPWTVKLYQSENLAIYRLDFAALDVPWRQGRGHARAVAASARRAAPALESTLQATVLERSALLSHSCRPFKVRPCHGFVRPGRLGHTPRDNAARTRGLSVTGRLQ